MRARLAVQLRFATGLTSVDYVKQQAWQFATLERCPLHPRGGCGLRRHGTYARKTPPGVQVPRWYCPEGHTTFSLLPDFAASRLSSSLQDVERVAAAVEDAPSLEAAASQLRPDIELPGAVRWTRRRVSAVRAILVTALGLLPIVFAGAMPTVTSFRSVMQAESVLAELRATVERHLAHLPPPVGFGPRFQRGGGAAGAQQHEVGPDPPTKAT